jgi:hypothetical protein
MARSARSERRHGLPERRVVVSPRGTSADRLSFTLRMVVAITVAAVGIAGVQWANTSSLKSDIRDIKTRLEARDQLDEVQAKLQEERAVQLREAVQAMRNRQELQQIEIQSLKEMILRSQQGSK